MSTKICLRRPFDGHVHLRGGPMLTACAKYTAQQFGRAIVMPNVPSIARPADVAPYRRAILDAASGYDFEPLMTLKMTAGTTPEMVRAAKDAGIVAVKIYPHGKTTGAEDGLTIDRIRGAGDVYAEMEQLGLVLCIHGEHPGPGVFCLDREQAILPEIEEIVETFTNLKVVLEHITSRKAVDFVYATPDTVAATITVHHLFLTLDDVLGGGSIGAEGKLYPDHYCAPVAKRPEDRESLVLVATSGTPKFFLGTDSAPHNRAAKLAECGCAGVFSAPVAILALCGLFEGRDALDRLEAFASVNGPRFYGLVPDEDRVTIEREPWTVSEMMCEEVGGLRPFLAGREMGWRVG